MRARTVFELLEFLMSESFTLPDATGAGPAMSLALATDPETGAVHRELLIALEAVASHEGLFQPKFPKWLAQNWGLWVAFLAEADAVWTSGRRHYSARTIIEFLRHQTSLRQAQGDAGPSGAPLKINNSYVPDIGRLYGLLHPSRETFFECRQLQGQTTRKVIRGFAVNDEHVQAAA